MAVGSTNNYCFKKWKGEGTFSHGPCGKLAGPATGPATGPAPGPATGPVGASSVFNDYSQGVWFVVAEDGFSQDMGCLGRPAGCQLLPVQQHEAL